MSPSRQAVEVRAYKFQSETRVFDDAVYGFGVHLDRLKVI